MDSRRKQTPAPGGGLVQWLKRPQVLFPAAIVGGMLLVAFGLQPGGASKPTQPDQAPKIVASASATTVPATATATKAAPTPTTLASKPTWAAGTPRADGNLIADPGIAPVQSEVLGARATPTAADPTLARQATECGGIQEAAIDLSIGQTLNGVSIRATKAAVFPIAYFRCILMATGGNEAFSLASSVGKSERDGATHAVLVDLWITNSGKDFGQLNLKTAALAAAGQTFAPLATLGGRAEVVISGGQGRSVTVVFAVKDSVGASIGPVTLVADAPLVGGKKMAGKYQLFLPTP